MHRHDTSRVSALSIALTLALLAQTAAAQTLPAAGPITQATTTLPNGLLTAEEHPWTIRILATHQTPVVPRRMYTATCNANGTTKFFASMTTQNGADTEMGTILSGDFVNNTIQNVSARAFGGCKEMAGIAADAGCTRVVALCRKPSGATGATKDLVQPLQSTATNWYNSLTEPGMDEMWLYEWKGTTTAPAAPTNVNTPLTTYVVSKAIGGAWEYGHQDVVMSGTHYGVSMKGTTNGHEGDTFAAVTRNDNPANVVIDTTRGWPWACAPGHTYSNRPVVNSGGRFAAFCTTDLDSTGNGGAYLRIEGSAANLAQSIKRTPVSANRQNGGATSIIPLSNGSYIGTIVAGVNASGVPSLDPSKIGLYRMNGLGALSSRIWVKSSSTHFLSYPQLAYLGNDTSGSPRYLLGWAQMMPYNAGSTFDDPRPDHTQRLATRYFVQEIDGFGVAKTQVREIADGWGEQDRMVTIGNGKVAWVYIPDPRIKLSADGTTVVSRPSPNSTQVRWSVYNSYLN